MGNQPEPAQNDETDAGGKPTSAGGLAPAATDRPGRTDPEVRWPGGGSIDNCVAPAPLPVQLFRIRYQRSATCPQWSEK
jgi:hypothetical protein